MNRLLTIWLALIVIVLPPQPHDLAAQDDRPEPASNHQPDWPPAARTTYKGRTIAQTMHYLGAEWLMRESREREERCSLLLTNLGLQPGQTVCDLGCGNGYYALPIAKLIGEQGQVLAVDIQVEMLQFLRNRMREERVNNVTPILGSLHDPRLAPNTCDLILLVDVYHEFSHPELMLQALRRALTADGLIALVEYRAEDPTVPIKKLHKMSKDQIMKEFPPNGLKLVKQFDGLPWQHVMFFQRDDRAGR